MKTRKLSTIFLSLLLVFTLLVAAGCEKDNPTDEPGKSDVVDKNDNNKDNKDGKDVADDKTDNTKTDSKTNNDSFEEINTAFDKKKFQSISKYS